MRADPAGWGHELRRAMAGKELLSQRCGAQPCKTLSILVSEFNAAVFSGVSSPSDAKEKGYRWYHWELSLSNQNKQQILMNTCQLLEGLVWGTGCGFLFLLWRKKKKYLSPLFCPISVSREMNLRVKGLTFRTVPGQRAGSCLPCLSVVAFA